jgi:glycine/D-amino acid oxidase-like deaminating enzyme
MRACTPATWRAISDLARDQGGVQRRYRPDFVDLQPCHRGWLDLDRLHVPQDPTRAECDRRDDRPLLRDRGARYVPALGEAAIRSVRICARPQSLDGRPLLGRVPGNERLFLASGNGPWGISTGPASARLVADLIRGLNVAVPTELSVDRFADGIRAAG